MKYKGYELTVSKLAIDLFCCHVVSPDHKRGYEWYEDYYDKAVNKAKKYIDELIALKEPVCEHKWVETINIPYGYKCRKCGREKDDYRFCR